MVPCRLTQHALVNGLTPGVYRLEVGGGKEVRDGVDPGKIGRGGRIRTKYCKDTYKVLKN